MIKHRNEHQSGDQHEMWTKQPEDQRHCKIIGAHTHTVIVAGPIHMDRNIVWIDMVYTVLGWHVYLIAHMVVKPNRDGKAEKCHEKIG